MVRQLLKLNGLAILGAVINHTAGFGVIAMFLWTHRYLPVTSPNFDLAGTPSYYFIRLLVQFIAYTIPVFIFVSGFFVAFATGQKQHTIPWKNVLTRVKFLFIPYLFWCIVAIVGLLLEGKTYSFVDYATMILTGSIKGPYYFIPLLIQLYLLSPILVPVARSRWKLLLFIAASISIVIHLTYYVYILKLDIPLLPTNLFVPQWLFPLRIFWFVFGLVVGFNVKQFTQWFQKVRWIALVLTMLFFMLGFFEWELIFNATHFVGLGETIIDSFYAFSLIVTFFGFQNIDWPLSKQLSYLGSNSFGIYLVHVPAQEYSARLIYLLTPWLLGIQAIFLPIIFIAGLFGPLLIMEVVRRTPARKYYQYLFG